jgi:hypothetical protein
MNAVSTSDAIYFPPQHSGLEGTFIEARGKDKIEVEEDPNHVVSAERDILIKPENIDEFRDNVLMKLNIDSSNGISCYSNLLISSNVGEYRTHQKEKDIAKFRLRYHLVPFMNSIFLNNLTKNSTSLLSMSRIAMIPKVKEGIITGHRAIGIGECLYDYPFEKIDYLIE